MNKDQIKAVLDRLRALHARIDAWMLANPAQTPADQAKMAVLSARQDTLLQKFNGASAQLLALVGKDISGPAGQLADLANQIEATANDIAEVESVISIVDQAIAAAAQIVAIAAT